MRKARCQAFSFLELLTVLAIVTVFLAAILIPETVKMEKNKNKIKATATQPVTTAPAGAEKASNSGDERPRPLIPMVPPR